MTQKHINKLAKLISLLTIYGQDPEWNSDIKTASKIWSRKEIDKIGCIDILNSGMHTTHDDILEWYKKNKIKSYRERINYQVNESNPKRKSV